MAREVSMSSFLGDLAPARFPRSGEYSAEGVRKGLRKQFMANLVFLEQPVTFCATMWSFIPCHSLIYLSLLDSGG